MSKPFGSYYECQECGSKLDAGMWALAHPETPCRFFIDNGCQVKISEFLPVEPGEESPFINKMHELHPEGFTLNMKTGKGFIIPVTFPPRSKGKTE